MKRGECYAVCRVEPGGLRVWDAPFRRLADARRMLFQRQEATGYRHHLWVCRLRGVGEAEEVVVVDCRTGRLRGEWVKPLPSLSLEGDNPTIGG